MISFLIIHSWIWMSILATLLIMVGSLISYRLGIKRGVKKFKKILKTGTGRYGIIKKNTYYGKIDHVIEVEELESAGEYVKINVIRICANTDCEKSTRKILHEDGFNEWVPKKDIVWYDDNIQRIRDEKLERILKER